MSPIACILFGCLPCFLAPLFSLFLVASSVIVIGVSPIVNNSRCSECHFVEVSSFVSRCSVSFKKKSFLGLCSLHPSFGKVSTLYSLNFGDSLPPWDTNMTLSLWGINMTLPFRGTKVMTLPLRGT